MGAIHRVATYNNVVKGKKYSLKHKHSLSIQIIEPVILRCAQDDRLRAAYQDSVRPMYSLTFSAASRVMPLRAARSSMLAALMALTDP